MSAYVSHSGEIIAGGCASSSINVKPSGPNDPYPPSGNGTASDIFHVEIDLGDEGTMAFDLAAKYKVVPGKNYNRWTGSMTGGIKGKKSYNGTAVYEQFSFFL